MEIRQLKYFIVLAEELNFSRAAEKLFISQPPLSKHIKSLEEELGVLLFERGSKGVTLTKEGKLFYEEARQIVHQTNQLTRKVKVSNHSYNDTLNIGFVYTAMRLFLPKIVKAFEKKFPEAKLKLWEYSSIKDFQDKLLNYELDIAFVFPPVAHEQIENTVIHSEDIYMVIPKSHPLANAERASITQFKEEHILLQPREVAPQIFDLFVYKCEAELGFQPKIKTEATSQQARIDMVEAEMGITYVSGSLRDLYRNVSFVKPIDPELTKVSIAIAENKTIEKPLIEEFKSTVYAILK